MQWILNCVVSGEKPYVCTVSGCGKRFTEYSSLYKHHVVHTHTKPYICNHCGKNYRQTSTLAMHKRTAHGDDSSIEADAALLLQQTEGNRATLFPIRNFLVDVKCVMFMNTLVLNINNYTF